MPGLVPIRCDGYEVTQAPGKVVYSDCQKNSHILPTGQWYTRSAVINDALIIRVSQKNQKSEFCFATKPTGFHRLDEPPEKISSL